MLKIERIIKQVQARLRGEPLEPEPPELVRADLVAERLARIIDRANQLVPIPAPEPVPEPEPPPTYITYEQLAKDTGLAVKTLQNAKSAGKLKGHGNGRGTRFTRRDVERFMQSR